jgi:hypothetical protein
VKTLQASVSTTTRFSARNTFALSALLIAAASGSALAQPAHNGTLTASTSSSSTISGTKRDASETYPLPVDRDGKPVVDRNAAARPAAAPTASAQPAAADAVLVETLKATYGWFEFPVVVTGSSDAQDASRTFEYFAVPATLSPAQDAHSVLGAYDVAGIAL